MAVSDKLCLSLSIAGAGSYAYYWFITKKYIVNGEESAPTPKFPWTHNGLLSSYDHASIRRGYEVYKQVCAACHSLKYVSYHNLVDMSHTAEEALAEAAQNEYEDGPNDEGQMYKRPGKILDYFPSPYPNDEAARAANNGALPPDLSYITKARKNGEDYLFSLLTGYSEPPAGIVVKDGQYYNKYFPGGAISMARALYDGIVDYEDGTPNTTSQLAKDVTSFLTWASSPEHDERKLMGLRAISLTLMITGFALYAKRNRWSYLKTKRLLYKR